jgi:hypothetical protein
LVSPKLIAPDLRRLRLRRGTFGWATVELAAKRAVR